MNEIGKRQHWIQMSLQLKDISRRALHMVCECDQHKCWVSFMPIHSKICTQFLSDFISLKFMDKRFN